MKESLIVVRGPIAAGKSSVSRATHELIADHASIVETDAIKRMLDPNTSSVWRRTIAHKSAAFIVEQLLQIPRTSIIEAHTKYPEELDRLALIAERYSVPMVNVLLTAPLEVCQSRAQRRNTPDITYTISEEMVSDYYCNLEPQSDDLVYDTSIIPINVIAASIVEHLDAIEYRQPSLGGRSAQ